jgi:hypothetical protein
MNYPQMKILLVLSIFFAPLSVVLGQNSTLQQHQGQLRGNLTLGRIGNITTEDIDKFELFLQNYTTGYYLKQDDGMVIMESVSVQVTNRPALINKVANDSSATPILFDESISYRTNTTISSLQVAFQVISKNSTAFLYAIRGIGGTCFGQVNSFSITMSG